MFKKTLSALSILALLAATTTPTLAGRATLKHANGSKVKLDCNSSGCYSRTTDAQGKKGKRTRIGPGGSANFSKNKAAFKAKGYK